jgi:pyruvate formate lyase activating enzyme
MNVIQGIKGFLGTSLIDYPGKVAAVVFLSGCNLRCPYCHNSALVREDEILEDLAFKELIESLQRRRKLLEGIAITGGEPTLHPQLAGLLRGLRETGLSLKLDTNGLRPEVLSELLRERLVDYVAVDMKLDPDRYFSQLGGPRDSAECLAATVELLRTHDVDHEYRTTCVPGLVGEEDIRAIVRRIAGAPAYYLQQYIPLHVDDPSLLDRPPFPREVLERFQAIAQPHFRTVELRNI